MNRFWLVMRDRNLLAAEMRHTSREAAKAEAVRLADRFPGLRFYVAAVTGYAETPPPNSTWHEMQTEQV